MEITNIDYSILQLSYASRSFNGFSLLLFRVVSCTRKIIFDIHYKVNVIEK